MSGRRIRAHTGAEELAADARYERNLTWKGLLALAVVVVVICLRAWLWV